MLQSYSLDLLQTWYLDSLGVTDLCWTSGQNTCTLDILQSTD
jgi:hypothetical protein